MLFMTEQKGTAVVRAKGFTKRTEVYFGGFLCSSGCPPGVVSPFPAYGTLASVRFLARSGSTVGKGRGVAAAISSSVQGRTGPAVGEEPVFPDLLPGRLAIGPPLVDDQLH